MLGIYAASAIIGGGLVVLGAFFGGDSDVDADMDADSDGDFDAEGGAWIPFLSFKFWTFGATFFGLTGMMLALLTPMGAVAQLMAAGPIGLLSGLGASWTLRRLSQGQITSAATENDMIGLEAQVLFPVSSTTPGKIEFTIRGQELTLLALTDEEEPLQIGERAVILEIVNGKARVLRPGKFLPSRDAADEAAGDPPEPKHDEEAMAELERELRADAE